MKTSLPLMLSILFLYAMMSYAFGQCPTTSCSTHSTLTSTIIIPECGVGSIEIGGDLDDGSDCSDATGDNCWQFNFRRHDFNIESISMDPGKGNGCTGEANSFYADSANGCEVFAGSGAQATYTFEFDANGDLTVWVCDNSSGVIALCEVCYNLLGALPVKFASFTGASKNNQVELSWSTEYEENNHFFEIQRSPDGITFENIGMAFGQGTSSVVNNYPFVDTRPFPFSYYRIKQVDFDGNIDYSEIITVQGEHFQSKLLVYPTQSSHTVTLRIETLDTRKSYLKIADLSGRILEETIYYGSNIPAYKVIDVSQYAPGLYIVSLSNNKEHFQAKFIVLED